MEKLQIRIDARKFAATVFEANIHLIHLYILKARAYEK